jgi:hypothetical protein
VFTHSCFAENPLIWSWETNTAFLRWFCHSKVGVEESDVSHHIDPFVFDFIFTRPPWWFHVHHRPSLLHQFWGKLGNPSPTCFQVKQAARSRCVSRTIFLPSVLWCNRKPLPAWFWGPNQETVMVILMPKSPNRSCWFYGPNQEIIDFGFDAKPGNPRSSSPCAWCRLNTASPDLPIVRWPSTQLTLDHPRSSTLGLLLLPCSLSLPATSHLSPTHHETSKHNSPHKIDSSRTRKMSWIWIQTMACQWLITVKPRY